MILINTQNNLRLIIDDDLLLKLSNEGISHFPNEFGGFLIGHYSDDFKTLFIQDYLSPQKYNGFSCLFERSTDGIENMLNHLFQKKRLYYIGEWHTHPNGSTMYSQTDLSAMTQIADSETVRIKNPVLLILSISNNNMNNFTFYLYDNKNLIKYDTDKY